jgi:hypothetical protein
VNRSRLTPVARTLAALLGAAALVVTAPRAATAQLAFTRIAVTGFPLTNTGPAVIDFDAGSVALGSTTFTIDLTLNIFGSFSPRVTTARVRCNPACPASGTLPLAGLQWRRSDLATWNTLTTTFATIETRTADFGGTNDPWSNTLFWRYLLSYTGTPPTAATAFNIQFQLQVTAP